MAARYSQEKLEAERNWIADAAAYSGCPADKVICPNSDHCEAHGSGGESHRVRLECWLEWARKEAVTE